MWSTRKKKRKKNKTKQNKKCDTCFQRCFHLDPLTLISDQDRISPYKINSIPTRWVLRIKKYINLGIINWSISKILWANLIRIGYKCFSSWHERESKKTFWVPIKNRASEIRIPRSGALPLSHKNSTVSEVSYEVYMTHTISKHDAIDIADPSSMQEMCHMNFVIDLAHRGVSVAQR